MVQQERYQEYSQASFFADYRSMRTPPEGTVPRSRILDKRLTSGRTADGYVQEIPIRVDRPLLERSRTKFEIYCAACHGLLADGNSMVARNMALRSPPTLHPIVATLPPGFLFTVVTEGYGVMPSYAAQIPPDERWGIVLYLRALHLSQTGRIEDAPPDVRELLEKEPPK